MDAAAPLSSSRAVRAMHSVLALALAGSLACVLSGCSYRSERIINVTDSFEMPIHRPTDVDKVFILPVLDRRYDKALLVDAAPRIQGSLSKRLAEIGYEPVTVADAASQQAVLPQRLTLPTPDWLATLGPPNSRWVLCVEVNDTQYKRNDTGVLLIWCTSYGLFAPFFYPKQTSIELTGYLFDKQNMTRPWWKHVTASQHVVESFITTWCYSKEDRLMVEEAAQQIVDDLPIRSKSALQASRP